MNFRRLKYFVKIVDIGSLTQAAEVLYIAQPTPSQQVTTPEGELNQQSLIRTKWSVTPAGAGEILYTYVWATLRQCEQAQLAVYNAGQSLSGQVPIGFAPGTVASSVTVPLLQAVRTEFSEVVIYLHENSGAVLSEKLINHQLDMVVVYEHSPVAGVSSQALLREDLFLVGTQDCPGQSVNVNATVQMNLFLPSDHSAVRLRVDKAFSLRRLTTKIIGGIESIATLTAAIAGGMGVAVLPEPVVRLLCGAVNGWVLRITTPSMSFSLPLNLFARANLSPQVQAVKELLMPVISSPVMEKRQWQLASQALYRDGIRYGFLLFVMSGIRL